MATSDALYDLLSTAVFVLDRSVREIIDLPLEPARANVDRISRALREVLALQASLLSAQPSLAPDEPDDPGPALSAADQAFAMCLVEASRLERERHIAEAVAVLERYLLAEPSLERRAVIADEIARLAASPEDDDAPDLLPSEAVLAHVGALSPSQLEAIDRTLLEMIGPHFQKLAFIVGETLTQLSDRLPPIPDVFYAQRVIRLVNLGLVEAQGDLRRMRSAEVRRAH